MAGERYSHIRIPNDFQQTERYAKKLRKIENRIPSRDPQAHAQFLKRKLEEAWKTAEQQVAVTHSERTGSYLEFKCDPGAAFVIKSLEDLRSKKVRLMNIREVVENDAIVTYATVYIAHEKKGHFFKKLEKYLREDGKTELINRLTDIRSALLVESFWTDNRELSPIPGLEKEFIEVWLSSDAPEARASFQAVCQKLEIEETSENLVFPERQVVVVKANKAALENLTLHFDQIAEYRRAKETAAFWLELETAEQASWVEHLRERLKVDVASKVSVCILDTGVNRKHPLIEPLLATDDCHTVEHAWASDDHKGHGTLMAGVCGFGDLKAALDSSEAIQISHKLESVKILPPRGSNPPHLWGDVTKQALYIAEIAQNERKRVLCLAITATDDRDRGRPSSWSGLVDKLASGADDGIQRLFIIAAGNAGSVSDVIANYPDALTLESVHDPAQSWNALTVGAFTELSRLTDAQLNGYDPLAAPGGISPFTSTSSTWDDKWPLKPDVLMEGGNLAVDRKGAYDESDDLCVISTYHDTTKRLLEGFNMTSAATAKAAWMAAQIQAKYPELWPETVRGLIVHSAQWTDKLCEQFLNTRKPSKTEIKRLIRICGWGVPSLERALASTKNNLTLFAESTIQPFTKGSSGYKANEMHLYSIPWPKEELLGLPPETVVTMRVTLSYFVEPSPGEIGWKDRYRYMSHGLRFELNAPGETHERFLSRISSAIERDDDDNEQNASTSDFWLLGSDARHKGSLHSDIWCKGSAQDLADSNYLAIFPIKGWWSTRKHLHKGESDCRYSLIVSIQTPAPEVDLYTPVSTQIGIPTPVQIEIPV
ncbi:MAG: S8 family peptidase [Opitutales bacterium]|nr:S8 family peptidase [Opitutales bacterium]